MEAVPAPVVKPLDEFDTDAEPDPADPPPLPADESVARSGETLRQGDWRDELLKTGIRGKAGQHISFARLEPLPGAAWLHVEGETHPDAAGADEVRERGTAWNAERVVISFGPDHTPLEQRQVALAIEEVQTLVPRPKVIVFAAFQFDPEAAKDIDETRWPGVTLLKAQMNADLLTEDPKRKRASNESFWLIGQPDVEIERIADGEHAGRRRVSVQGFDYYNTRTGGVESGGKEHIALWMLDPDYDGRSLFPREIRTTCSSRIRRAADLSRIQERPPASVGHSEIRRDRRGGGVTGQRGDEGQAPGHPLDGGRRNAQPLRQRPFRHSTRRFMANRPGRPAPLIAQIEPLVPPEPE